MMAISDRRMEMLCSSWISAFLLLHPILLTPFHGKLYVGHHRCQWLHPILSVKKVQMLCQGTANHLSVLDHVGIESIDSFAFVITPNNREFEARHSHSIPESYLEYHRQGLDFSDSHECRHQFYLIPRRFWLRNLRDTHSIGYRTEVVVRHTFVGWGRAHIS